jgi:hypothetical protein
MPLNEPIWPIREGEPEHRARTLIATISNTIKTAQSFSATSETVETESSAASEALRLFKGFKKTRSQIRRNPNPRILDFEKEDAFAVNFLDQRCLGSGGRVV